MTPVVTPNPSPRRKKGSVILLTLSGVLSLVLVGLILVLFVFDSGIFSGDRLSEAEQQAEEARSLEAASAHYDDWNVSLLAAAVDEMLPGTLDCRQEGGNFFANARVTGGFVPLKLSADTSTAFTGALDGGQRPFLFQSRLYSDETFSPEVVAAGYAEHIEQLTEKSVQSIVGNLDCDNETEALLVIDGFTDAWMENLIPRDEAQSRVKGLLSGGTSVWYLDRDATRSTVQAHFSPEPIGEVEEILCDNGLLHLQTKSGKLVRLFNTESSLTQNSYENDEDTLRRLCARFVTWRIDRNADDVRTRLADVSRAPGKELLCCTKTGDVWTVNVYSARYGRICEVYREENVDENAVFLVEEGDRQCLFSYQQKIEGYEQNYTYSLFYLDEGYNNVVQKEDSLSINTNQSADESAGSFFEDLNGYLSDATVCYDPYVLTGYEVMPPEGGEDSLTPAEKYLRIANCSTSKAGFVKIMDPTSYLNFREGPGVAYDRILLNSADKDSFVRQPLGSPMTILAPVNTDNAENPTWVRIRITYQDRTLEGFSSQRYVDIPGIRHLAIGEHFTVTAQTNDTGLTWRSSDSSVLSIDATSGEIIAHRSGLVLVTVTSQSGLSDSCLILVD